MQILLSIATLSKRGKQEEEFCQSMNSRRTLKRVLQAPSPNLHHRRRSLALQEEWKGIHTSTRSLQSQRKSSGWMDGWWWFVGYHIRRTNGIRNAGHKSHHIEKWFCTQEAPEGFGSLISCVEALWHFMRVSKLLDRMLLFPKVFSVFETVR